MAIRADELPGRFKLDVRAYHCLADAGTFDARRVELLDGEIVEMPPVGPRHVNLVNRLTRTFVLAAGERAIVSVQNPILLPEHSEPEPDLVLLRPEADEREDETPSSRDVLLAVEVSDSTLRHDRDVKVPLYARHGVPEVWVIDVRARSLLRFRTPREGDYVTRDVPGLVAPLELMADPEIVVDLSGLFGSGS